jgi:predicted nucleic acid-binding protein
LEQGTKRSIPYIKKILHQFQLDTDSHTMTLKALEIIDKHLLKDGIGLNDALIAATAIEHNSTLLTLDQKHLGKIAEVKLYTLF